jgi:hypothetical protein
MSASGFAPRAEGRKQSPTNIRSVPAAIIQLAVFEDMMLILNAREKSPMTTSNPVRVTN